MSARRRAERILFALAFVLGGLAVVLPGGQAPAGAAEGVTKSVTAVRTFIDADGKETEQSRDKVKLRVSQTTNLRGRQEIKVSWEGAHPTGAVAADPSSSDARNQEYPFVLLQCRGVDTDSVAPKGQVKLSPETCWTQTAPERYLAAASNTPSWRFDAWAQAKDRQAVVGPPADLPAACSSVSRLTTERWLPFKAAGGTTYYGGPDPGTGCMPLPPESDDAESGGLPSNTTYGITGKDGKGSVDFAVWTKAENASLGCSAKVACSLVAVPVVGISCDAWGTTLPEGTQLTTKAGVPLTESQVETGDATCRRTGSYEAGEPAASRTSDQAVRGNLWWSASNWRNRITVPLEFAQTAEVCPVESAEKPLELMGSVMLNELTASWRPKFCTTSSLYSFTHVQQAESLARSLVQSGEIKGAFSTAPQPGGYQRPVAQAPIAFSGFAIAFSIDDGDKQRREELNLNARLVAKLLSASYPAVSFVRNGHPGLGDNPLNITLDPEFRALNPGIDERSTLQAGAALQIFSSNSDLVWALTRWLDADPEARAWLDGTPDPWGMKVNPAYKGLELPVDNWPLLDDYVAPQWYIDDNACYRKSPTPYLQLVANPLSGLGAIGLNLQFASSAAATVCRYDGYDATTLPLRTEGRQSVGYRFVLGLVSLPAARRYNLRTAALQSTSTVATGQQFGDAAGRTFVEPDTTGLKAAAGLLAADDDAGTWVLDDAELATAKGRAAYPGAMPVYAVFPTSGEEKATATKLAKFLCYAGGAGQVPGQANGSLPAGYLPLTDDNGFATQHAYLANAVNAVRAQEGAVPALEVSGKAPTLEKACDFSTAAAPVVEPAGQPGGGSVVPPAPVAVDPAPVAEKPVVVAVVPTTEAPLSLTSGEQSSLGRVGLPTLLLLAVASAVAGSVLRWLELLQGLLVSARSSVRGARGSGGRRRAS
ncbi:MULTISPECIES: hypothetical protein [unclassified Nocardioides]|uniref:hypothetical protein n=1 Tax=unclassified Nocardioides TaxID=2615069 RepID=UPI000702D9F0|nr:MULTISPECIES: hypothetical protein [unclassified Nocardioides]KRC56650.1 hypothetical protein ASE19_02125 [Nocardioides sp. Root79]KRC76861.1 hypothetical protein ASE20_00995 [Nocardioides sp. Root240]